MRSTITPCRFRCAVAISSSRRRNRTRSLSWSARARYEINANAVSEHPVESPAGFDCASADFGELGKGVLLGVHVALSYLGIQRGKAVMARRRSRPEVAPEFRKCLSENGTRRGRRRASAYPSGEHTGPGSPRPAVDDAPPWDIGRPQPRVHRACRCGRDRRTRPRHRWRHCRCPSLMDGVRASGRSTRQSVARCVVGTR